MTSPATVWEPTPAPSGLAVDRRTTRAIAFELLATRRVRTFLGLQGLGQAGDAMTTLVLAHVVVFRLDRGAAPDAIGRMLLVVTLPWLVAGPLAGWATDRFDRRTVLSAAALGRAVICLVAVAVATMDDSTLGYTVTALLLGLGATAFVVRSASWPHLVDGEQLVVANSLSSITAKIAGSSGFVTAATVGLSHPVVALGIATTCHTVGAVGFRLIGSLGGGREDRVDGPPWPVVVRRLHRMATRQPTRTAIMGAVVQRALYGAAFVAFVLLADRRYSLSASGYAAAIGLTATGAFAGTLVAPLVSGRLTVRPLVTCSFVATAVAMAAARASTESASVIVAMVIASCSFQVVRLVTDATVQRHVADDSLGRVFAGFDVLYNLSYLAGATVVVMVRITDPLWYFGALALAHTAVVVVRATAPARRPRESS